MERTQQSRFLSELTNSRGFPDVMIFCSNIDTHTDTTLITRDSDILLCPMADHTMYRPSRGGTAHVGSGAALLDLYVNPGVEIAQSVFMAADADTVQIIWRTNANSRPSTIADVLASSGGKKRHVALVNKHWIDFEGPEYTHNALKQLGTIAEIETALVYNVHFRLPSEVANIVREEFDGLAAAVPEILQSWRGPGPGTSMLRLSGTDRQSVIDVSRCAQDVLMGRTINLEPDTGPLRRHEV
ncbi:hypothetical protein SVAN01_08997 [Stagonosporopsis vannaccii]|nr:hypothetical protein SVAN01_08997 [Stagonosporopsis vannaccii]